MRTPSLLFAALFTVGCHAAPEPQPPQPGQPFPQALTMMCDVDRLAGLTPDAEPLAVGPRRTAWISEHVDNPDAIELRTLMSVKGAAEQASMLRDRAKEAGVTRCALADTLEKTGLGGLAP